MNVYFCDLCPQRSFYSEGKDGDVHSLRNSLRLLFLFCMNMANEFLLERCSFAYCAILYFA